MEIKSNYLWGVTVIDMWSDDNYTRLYICTLKDARVFASVYGYNPPKDDNDILDVLNASFVRSTHNKDGETVYVVES